MDLIGQPMSVIHAAKKHLRRENSTYPERPIPVPWGKQPPDDNDPLVKRTSVLRSRKFLIQIVQENEKWIRMTVNRTEIEDDGNYVDGISWDELQQLKDQCGYEQCTMIEIYPPQKSVVNVANMRHLWLVPPELAEQLPTWNK